MKSYRIFTNWQFQLISAIILKEMFLRFIENIENKIINLQINRENYNTKRYIKVGIKVGILYSFKKF